MTAAELLDAIRSAVAALAPLGRPDVGFSLYHSPAAAFAAAASAGAEFCGYGKAGDGTTGYLRLQVDGMPIALHDYPVEHALAAGFTTARAIAAGGGRMRRRR